MPQLVLPLYPSEVTMVSTHIGFQKKDDRIYYFHGSLPLFSHEEHDIESFRFITSQIVVNGNATQIEIANAFGVPYVSVKRAVKRLRTSGSKGFFQKQKGRSSHVLTASKLCQIQERLNQNKAVSEIALEYNLKANTIRKAIQAGRLKKKKKV